MTTTVAELNPCACGCGTMVKGTWARGHSVRGRGDHWPRDVTGPDLLPSPDDPFEDLGELEPDPLPGPPPGPPPPPVDIGELPPDPEPSWLGDKAKPRRGRPPGKSGKPSAAVANDIRGQLALLIGTFAQMLQVADPVCGSVAVANTVPMADAWTDVILQSPGAVAFFTGPAGNAMLVFRAMVASAPLVAVAYNHHVTHRIVTPGREGEPVQERQYAA